MNEIGASAQNLRHGLRRLRASEIADQFYCEYKVHLKRLHPEVQFDLPPLELGSVSHIALASQAQPITPAEIEHSIQTGKKFAVYDQWELEGSFRGVPISGRPDFFAFEGKKALLLLDFKFSRATRPFRGQEVQTEVYALLAESMGFSTEELSLGIVLFPQAALMPGRSVRTAIREVMLRLFNSDGTLQAIHERCLQRRNALLTSRSRQAIVEAESWRAFLFRYDREKATQAVSHAVEYWVSEREPEPEKRNPRKCTACPLNAAGLCQHALEAPDPDFTVQRTPDGRVFVFRRSSISASE